MPVEITPPDLKPGLPFLRSKVEEDHIDIGNDTLNYIAARIDTNVRELEGLDQVQVYADLSNEIITPTLHPGRLATPPLNQAPDYGRRDSKQVASFYNITQADIMGKKRVKQIVMPRQIAMYLTRELTDYSLPKIGKEFGGKDHTTVLHAIDKIEASAKDDSQLQKDIHKLKDQLQA